MKQARTLYTPACSWKDWLDAGAEPLVFRDRPMADCSDCTGLRKELCQIAEADRSPWILTAHKEAT